MTNYNQSYKHLWGVEFQTSVLFKGEKNKNTEIKATQREKNELLKLNVLNVFT